MRRLIIFLLILLTFTGQISADSLSSSSVSSGASIPMILKKPASATESVNVGFSKTDPEDTTTTITGTQYLTLSKGYLKDPSSTITVSETYYYPYWVVYSQSDVDINLSWYLQKKGPSDTEASDVSTSDSIFDVTVKNSSGTEYTDKTTVDDNTTRIKLSTVRSYNSENEYAEIGIKTKDGTDLGNEEYGTVYTLTFTLKVENS